MRSLVGSSVFGAVVALFGTALAESPPLPEVAAGWNIRSAGETPKEFIPLTLGRDQKGVLVGGSSADPGSGLRGGVLRNSPTGWTLIAEELDPVVGLEWRDGAIFVLHGATLSILHDVDGDGRYESRKDLTVGLGRPASGAFDDHGANALAVGMDGFLYIAVGDKGIVRAEGLDGSTIVGMEGGGVVRVRPDGTRLEVYSTGDARTVGLALSDTDDVFTLSAADDPRWGVRLIHALEGGRYGYPYQFVTAPFRALPTITKLEGRRSGRGAALDDEPNTLAFCEPDAQAVFLYVVRKAGGASALVSRTPLATQGALADFHPIAVAADRDGLWILDAASNREGRSETPARLYRLARSEVAASTPASDPNPIDALDAPSRADRLQAQNRLIAAGADAAPALISRLERAEPQTGRMHALWALDRIGTPVAIESVRSRLDDDAALVRRQAARSVGGRRDVAARDALLKLLTDRDPAVRREAAVALARLGDDATVPSLLTALGDADPVAAWAIRRAVLELKCKEQEALVAALLDPRRREAALLLADESWNVVVVQALVEALKKTPEDPVRGRMLSCLAGQYRRRPDWSGSWFGPNPLSSPLPRKTEPWDEAGMAAVFEGLKIGLKDEDDTVRYQAILGLQAVGAPAAVSLREGLEGEHDEDNQAALVEALGALNDAESTRLLLPIVVDPERAESVRSAALDSLNLLRGRDVVTARLTVLYEEDAPESLVAKALPALARDGFLPLNDLAGFLHHASPLVRAAAVMSLNPSRPLPDEIKRVVLDRIDDEDSEVRRAALLAAGPLKLREAVPALLKKVENADEDRAVVLNALCSLPDARAVRLYVEALDDADPSLRRGAIRALLAIRTQTASELRRLAAEPTRSPESASALARVLARYQPVQPWSVVGPLPSPPPALIARDGSIDRSQAYSSTTGEPIRWVSTPQDPRGVVDLASALGLDATPADALSAAHVEFDSPEARNAILIVDADGPIELFHNGTPINAREGADHYELTLSKGVNRLFAVSRPGASGWRFIAAVSQPESAASPESVP